MQRGPKTLLGVDIGHDQLKVALVTGGVVKKTAVAQMPEKLLRSGRIVSVEALGELLRETLQQARIRCKNAAVVVSGDTVFVRNVTMPRMTVKQLEYNLPFEFRDYISGELKDYLYDYAVLTPPGKPPEPQPEPETPPGAPQEDGEEGGLQLLTVAVPTEQLDELRQCLRKAGMKMAKAAPSVCSYAALLAGQGAAPEEESCVLDLGYSAIRLYVFKGAQHVVTRVLEQGMSTLDQAIADAYHIDVHLAHTYLLTNHEDCQRGEACTAAFTAIAVELMRALNFYRFSNPDSNLTGMWLCGGGANIRPLQTVIQSTLDIAVHPADTLAPDGAVVENCAALAQAIGITQT